MIMVIVVVRVMLPTSPESTGQEVYAVVFFEAIVVKVRDGQVANGPVYAAIGVTLAGEKDVLGLWAA
jgi:transposase-like protein